MSLNTLQDKHSSPTTRDSILVLVGPAHKAENQQCSFLILMRVGLER